jgi:hypothetical protein
MNHVRALLICVASGVVLIACASSRGQVASDTRALAIAADVASPHAVQVSLREYAIDVEPNIYAAGRIDFVAKNTGREEHELVIVPRDGDRYGPPVAQVKHIGTGESQALRVQLEPGRYSLVCLIVSRPDEQLQSHMALGMEASFEVTD